MVKRHFTRRNPLSKIFNKNNMRVSYSCMTNLGAIIKQHNAKILYSDRRETERGCNCRDKNNCPFKEQQVSCQAKGLVYKAEVSTRSQTKYYIGLAEKEFKWRYRKHMSSFNLERDVNPTLLSGYVRNLKRKGEESTIKWSVLKRAQPATDGGAACRLCLREAVAIAYADGNCLNKRSEVVHVCPHKRKFLLQQYPSSGAPG